MKNIIYLSILTAGLIAAPLSHAAPTIFGKVRVSYNIFDIDDTKDTDKTSVSSNASRLGFKDKMKIDDEYTVMYQIETGVKINGDGTDHFSPLRNTFVGISSKSLGKIRMGNIDTAYKTSTTKIDVFGGTVADYNQAIGAASNSKHSKFFNIRAKEILVYNSPKFGGFQVNASHSNNQKSEDDATKADINNTSLNVSYTNKPWYFTLGYEAQKQDNDSDTAIVDDTVTGSKFGAMYKSNPVRVGFVYESTDNDADDSTKTRDTMMLNGSYQVDKNTYKAMVWVADESDAGDDGATGISFGVAHNMGKGVEVYGIYSMIDNDDNAKYGFNAAFVPSVTPGGTDKIANGSAAGSDLSVISFGVNYNFGY